jgi:hypothetical protein
MSNQIAYRIGLENGIEGRSLACVLGHPGCFAYGADGDEALAKVPAAIQDYSDWIAGHAGERWLAKGASECELAETWEVYHINRSFEVGDDGYSVESWFKHDWKPLTAVDVERSLKLLAWSREDLLAVVEDLAPADLDTHLPDQRWSIRGILGHVAGADWWYLDRLGLAFPRALVPDDAFERLRTVRAHLRDVLPRLVDSRQVVGVDGEFWSPRKVLRRAAWHERDHTAHILQLREASGV